MSRRNPKKASKARKQELASYEISGYASDGLVLFARPDTTVLSPEAKKNLGFRINLGQQPLASKPKRGKH